MSFKYESFKLSKNHGRSSAIMIEEILVATLRLQMRCRKTEKSNRISDLWRRQRESCVILFYFFFFTLQPLLYSKNDLEKAVAEERKKLTAQVWIFLRGQNIRIEHLNLKIKFYLLIFSGRKKLLFTNLKSKNRPPKWKSYSLKKIKR